MVIKCNIGTQKFKKKPTSMQMGGVRTDLGSLLRVKEITPEELINIVEEGRAFTPGVMAGTTSEAWNGQQVIAIDIDNQTQEDDPNDPKGKKKIKKPLPKEEQLTPEEALEILKAEGLAPYFIYNTFSSSEEWRRFRLVFILDEVLEDPAAPNALQCRLVDLFQKHRPKSTDEGTTDNARIFLGSVPGSVFYKGGNITKVADLWKLPESRRETEERQREEEKKARAERLANMNPDFAEREKILQDSIKAFDLADYVEKNTGSTPKKKGNYIYFNPCPVCGHNDDFYIDRRKPWRFTCKSSATPDEARGTIIDFLMWEGAGDRGTPGRSEGEALEIFKYKILGWDEKEDKRMFAQAMEAKERAEIDAKRKAAASESSLEAAIIPDEEQEAGEAAKDPGEDPAQKQETTPAAAQEKKPKTYDDILADFWDGIQTEQYRPVQTGIEGIDKALDGGFTRKTLVTLGAAPGMGKTALAQWIFEGMAANNNEVLYINLEMSREQLIARSLSRMVYQETGEDLGALEILRGYKWSDEKREKIGSAWKKYKEKIAPRFKYNPNASNSLGVSMGMVTNEKGIIPTLKRFAEAYKANGKPAPIVCVDYLQIIQTDQKDPVEGIKEIIKTLKDFAIEYNTIVFLILANNRASNKEGRSDMESSRDTSAIEYSGDIMLGLTYTAIEDGYKAFLDKVEDKINIVNPKDKAELARLEERIPTKTSKGQTVKEWFPATMDDLREMRKQSYDDGEEVPEVCRKVSLKIVKNRFGSAERRIHLIFDGKHSSYEEDNGFIGVAIPAKDLPWKTDEVKTEFKGRNFKTGEPVKPKK